MRTPFEHYMEDPTSRYDMNWRGQRNYPRPDYLSSSRKRLAPQLIFKGGILNSWQRKMAVALNVGFYNTLPILEEVDKADADIAWLIYDLEQNISQSHYNLSLHKTVYTKCPSIWRSIMRRQSGEESGFIAHLQTRLDEGSRE